MFISIVLTYSPAVYKNFKTNKFLAQYTGGGKMLDKWYLHNRTKIDFTTADDWKEGGVVEICVFRGKTCLNLTSFALKIVHILSIELRSGELGGNSRHNILLS